MRAPVARFVLALVCIGSVVAPAHADMGAPWETKTVANYRITTSETHPAYVFVVYWHVTKHYLDKESHKEVPRREDWAEYVNLAPDHPVDVTRPPATSDPVTFLIVPRTAAAQFKTPLELGEAVIAGRVESASRHDLSLIKRGPWWMRSRVIDYRLRRAADDSLEFLPTNQDEGYQCCLVGCGAPALLFVGSLWLICRARRSGAPTPQS